MMGSTFHFEHEGLVIDFNGKGDPASIRWSGVGDSRDPAVRLRPFFAVVVAALRGRAVVVDFRQLDYMSSAMVAPLIHLVKELSAAGARTTLLFDVTIPWQKANAHAMRAIGRTLENVEVP